MNILISEIASRGCVSIGPEGLRPRGFFSRAGLSTTLAGPHLFTIARIRIRLSSMTSVAREMFLFDQLPPAVRAALNDHPIRIESAKIAPMVDAIGEAKVVEALKVSAAMALSGGADLLIKSR